MRHINFIFLILCSAVLVLISFINSDNIVKFTANYLPTRTPTSEKIVCNSDGTSTALPATMTTNVQIGNESLNFFKKYPFLLKCNTNYTQPWSSTFFKVDNYTRKAESYTHIARIVRGVMVYYPFKQHGNFAPEFKWLYQSWLQVLKHEPMKWRTDLLVFIDTNLTANVEELFSGLNCSFNNTRLSNHDLPMCRLLPYRAVKDRSFNSTLQKVTKDYVKEFIEDADLFDDNDSHVELFKYNLKVSLGNYGYLDSIFMAFESYHQLKNFYNFLIRSDMDVFLTPLFSEWLPVYCNDFYVGRGGYSENFNMNRLNRIAGDLGMEYAFIRNLGSTWYSTPEQFRIASYMTLFGMLYISNEEFSPPEKDGKVFLWPYWHYGVLLLYGQNLAMNHLIQTKQMNIIYLPEMIDFPTGNTLSVFNMLHLHVFHSSDLFSKFVFKAGRYDNYTRSSINETNFYEAKYYTLRLALDSKFMNATDKHDMYTDYVKNRI